MIELQIKLQPWLFCYEGRFFAAERSEGMNADRWISIQHMESEYTNRKQAGWWEENGSRAEVWWKALWQGSTWYWADINGALTQKHMQSSFVLKSGRAPGDKTFSCIIIVQMSIPRASSMSIQSQPLFSFCWCRSPTGADSWDCRYQPPGTLRDSELSECVHWKRNNTKYTY